MQEYRRYRRFIILSALIAAALITATVIAALRSVYTPPKKDEIEIKVFDPVRAVFSEMSVIEQNGETMVPFRRLFERFGAVVTWNEQTETARASNPKSNLTVSVKIGDSKAVVNGVETAISAPAQTVDGVPYVPFDFLRQIPGVVISEDINKNLKIWSADIFIRRHGWTQLSDGLIAHAGGGLYKDENGEQISQIYTNSREAMENSYSNGHKVFEIDFLLTTDGKLAAVHDWQRVDGQKSSEEWKGMMIEDMYKALFIEDVYEFMLEYPDTFLVTDTKSFFNDTETNIKQVEQLVDIAKEMDGSLLQRIVPQVYDQDCYSILMGVYAFDSVIYTLYESLDTPEEVAEFVAACDNIKVVAMMWTQLTGDFYKALAGLSKYAYFFTINIPGQVEIFRMWGARGFYTDYLNPKLAPVPAPDPSTFVKLVKKIYIMFSPSSLIQIFVLLFIFEVRLIQGFILFLGVRALYDWKLKNSK